MIKSANLGFPRIGAKRELKKALEAYWKGESDREMLQQTAADLRARHWRLQDKAGIDIIPSNDFSLYRRDARAYRRPNSRSMSASFNST